MKFRTLLIHRCELLTPGTIVGKDPYGRDIVETVKTENVPCRFDRIRQRAAADETGTDFIYEHVLFFDKQDEIKMDTEIRNITDKEGNSVLPGSFFVRDILPIYKRKLHHYEVTVQRK